ncbi:YggS family pyridoxal phosphate-dependent enzyme [Flavobacterium selenitireducens]|uniref:YggS family pyridoxal phosphate-dependent enzyme n=1 Tax=Flavobacterium selenitireducens TaxID=2722704 RepID=UPI00168A5F6E|nr:YggS family pyridoxal phosphate-dependent enzyme [Flavobacterium selenitireducens]MBD3583060.1 YggS family pyridoxal phosphate-dependent enzyme [Flavobacterium selenitireducens]
MKSDITHNIGIILERIRKASEASGRDPKDVRLLLATKTVAADRIKEAFHAGQTLIAENKVQELRDKFEALKDVRHTSHFIGHLQTNKINDVLKYGVSCIQSVDRVDLAEKLHKRLSYENRTIEVLIQVNTSNEESKFGVHPDQAIELVRQVAQFKTLKIKGLMTIGLFKGQPHELRACFSLLRKLRDQISDLAIPGVEMDELSMGMSGDLEMAVEEGATIVRVGTAIFGQRVTPDSYYWNEQ